MQETRSRKITMTAERSDMLSLASASLGLSSGELIDKFITAGLLTLAEKDNVLALAMARVGGMSWDDLEDLAARGVRMGS